MKTNPDLQLMTFDYEDHAISFLSDGYMNLTEMCRAFNKRPVHFLQLESTRRFITALAAKTGLTEPELLTIRFGGNQRSTEYGNTVLGENSKQGTWAHPQIAMVCAQWLSPDFAIACNLIVFQVISGQIASGTDHDANAREDAHILRLKAELREAEARRDRRKDIPGNVSLLGYAMAAGVKLLAAHKACVSVFAKRWSRAYSLRIGSCRQAPSPGKKRSEVATFEPEAINRSLFHYGYIHDEPALPDIERDWKLLLPASHRLNSLAPLRLKGTQHPELTLSSE